MSQQDPYARFLYSPLPKDCIRLLQLLPSESGNKPRLKLIDNVPYLQGEVKYTALSYCWGDPTDTLPATVNGQEFKITRNLHEALVPITSHHTDLVGTHLWVDSICINQQDEEEKGHQVAQMWRIFRKAQRVLAWLGTGDETSEKLFKALDLIHKLPDHKLPEPNSAIDPDNPIFTIVHNAEQHSTNNLSPSQKLVNRTYFSRVWMITECVQASELAFLCGEHFCTWRDLEFYFLAPPCLGKFATATPLIARSWHQSFLLSPEGFQGPPELDQMWDCLDEYSNAKCTDIRDRVYAMLGHPFIRDLDPDGRLVVDYSFSNEELFVVALAWIDEVCGHIRDNATGYHPETFAGDYELCLKSSLEITYTDDFQLFISSHRDWIWDSTSARLILPNGKALDCSGPVFQHLINRAVE